MTRLPTGHTSRLVRHRAGVTLIETLIVVVMIAILAAVAMADYRTSKKSAALAAAKLEVVQVAAAAQAYYNKHGVYPADIPYNTSPAPAGSGLDYTPAPKMYWGLYYRTGDGQAQDAYIRHADALPDFLCHVTLGSYPNSGTVVCITYSTF